MVFTFRLVFGSSDIRAESDCSVLATGLLDAVKKLKDYLSNFQTLVIVGYDYLVCFDDGVLLPRTMSDDFYNKFILEDFQDV